MPLIEDVFYARPVSWIRRVALTPVLWIGWGYALVMRARAWAYRSGVLRSTKAALPVVSVGNLTVGGTGKTPVTIWLARRLSEAGRKPVVISRGYRGSLEGRVALVGDGSARTLDAAECGDEPALLADSLPGVPVVIGAKRAEAVAFAEANTPADVVIADDAFQHMALRRDLDVVCVNGALGFGNHLTLPFGPLREPFSALRRADLLAINVTNGERDDIESTARRVGFGGPVVRWRYEARALRDVATGERRDVAEFRDAPVHALAATARPAGFFALLRQLGLNVVAETPLPDHRVPTAEDFRGRPVGGGEAVAYHVVTEKDAVKLRGVVSPDGRPILALEVAAVFGVEEAALVDRLLGEVL